MARIRNHKPSSRRKSEVSSAKAPFVSFVIYQFADFDSVYASVASLLTQLQLSCHCGLLSDLWENYIEVVFIDGWRFDSSHKDSERLFDWLRGIFRRSRRRGGGVNIKILRAFDVAGLPMTLDRAYSYAFDLCRGTWMVFLSPNVYILPSAWEVLWELLIIVEPEKCAFFPVLCNEDGKVVANLSQCSLSGIEVGLPILDKNLDSHSSPGLLYVPLPDNAHPLSFLWICPRSLRLRFPRQLQCYLSPVILSNLLRKNGVPLYLVPELKCVVMPTPESGSLKAPLFRSPEYVRWRLADTLVAASFCSESERILHDLKKLVVDELRLVNDSDWIEILRIAGFSGLGCYSDYIKNAPVEIGRLEHDQSSDQNQSNEKKMTHKESSGSAAPSVSVVGRIVNGEVVSAQEFNQEHAMFVGSDECDLTLQFDRKYWDNMASWAFVWVLPRNVIMELLSMGRSVTVIADRQFVRSEDNGEWMKACKQQFGDKFRLLVIEPLFENLTNIPEPYRTTYDAVVVRLPDYRAEYAVMPIRNAFKICSKRLFLLGTGKYGFAVHSDNGEKIPGSLVALSDVLRQDYPDGRFSVCKHFRGGCGLTIVSSLPSDRPAIQPTLLGRFASFLKSYARFALSGFEKAPEHVVEKRLLACSVCEHRTFDENNLALCSVCGCYLTEVPPNFPVSVGKAMWASEDCPLALWPKN